MRKYPSFWLENFEILSLMIVIRQSAALGDIRDVTGILVKETADITDTLRVSRVSCPSDTKIVPRKVPRNHPPSGPSVHKPCIGTVPRWRPIGP